ncbi:MAG TPA: hypothetical protein VMT30_02430 [Candidatus Saccharimonadia bacterium]|nr:hypothetical protein [Candidatus Saccharimonadia bacterium]
MSIVISSDLVITDSVSGGGVITGDNPLIGYDNIVTTLSISALTAAAGFPASNMANPSTNLRWVGELSSPEADEYVTVTNLGIATLDYIAIAKHNLFTAQIAVSVEALDVDASPDTWVELVAPVILPNDGPALFRFTPFAYASIRLRLQSGNAAPTIAVCYAGALLVLQRRIYVGHTPINYGRSAKVINARSESGNFLGRIITNQKTATAVKLQNLMPDWYRTYFEPFLLQAQENPFFFAWRPSSYPREVGYAWLTNDPQPANQRPNGMMSVDFEMGGIV